MSQTQPNEWPQYRAFPFSDVADTAHLAAAWQFSAKRLRAIRQVLENVAAPVACIAVSGSLNRMEGHAGSDLDLLVVVDDRTHAVSQEYRDGVFAQIWQQLEMSGDLPSLKAAKPGGVFSTAASWNSMTDLSNRGVIDEDIITFGQRMQLLLDAQPVGR